MEWINPKESLPRSETSVLITIKAGTLTVEGYCGDDETVPAWFVGANDDIDGLPYPHFCEWQSNHIFENSSVMAWMPFPKPFTEEAKNA